MTYLRNLSTRVVEEVDQLRPFPLDLEKIATDVGVVLEISAEVLRGFS